MQTINATSNNFDFASYCTQGRQLVENKLSEYLTVRPPEKLWESMRYSVLSGGKRMRALLCLAAAQAVQNNDNNSLEPYLPCSCALEMVHAMSLIHDDLPALDNDDYRRGQLTNHKVYGEAMALLAGDALLMLAVEILIKYTPANIDPSILLQVVTGLSQAAGAPGMVGGQVLDLAFTGQLTGNDDTNHCKQAETVETIHKGKTGALIKFAVWSGAKLAAANESQLNTLEQFAHCLGLAFQIADDMLDLTGNLATLGKTPGKDQAANKVTWVTVFGPQKAQEKLRLLEEEGLAALNNSLINPMQARPLKELLKYAIHRDK